MGRWHCIALMVVVCIKLIFSRPTEDERVELWYKNGNKWPPTWQEETPQMARVKAKQEEEIMSLTASDERWENWLQFTQGRLVPKFTTHGFELRPIPTEVFAKLRDATERGLDNWDQLRSEGNIDVILNNPGHDPKFIDIGSLSYEVLKDLQSIHEEWAGGIKLRGTSAYGVRMYQNGSSLVMHYDRVQTHVISSIVHIAHEYDNDDEPWPIQIEDHNGKLHSVNLEPGQMLFYGSSKCLHGRMKLFKGKYYGSIFLHYAPVDKSIWNYDLELIIASVPPHWKDNIIEENGSRYTGASFSINSRLVENAPPRVVNGEYIPDPPKSSWHYHIDDVSHDEL